MASRSSTLASLSTSPDRLNTTSDKSVLMESSRVGEFGEHAFHVNGAQCLRGTVDQIGGAGRFNVIRHLRGVQRTQCAGHAFGDFGGVFDAVAGVRAIRPSPPAAGRPG